MKAPTIGVIVTRSTPESDEDMTSHSDLSVLDQGDDFGGNIEINLRATASRCAVSG